METCGGLGVHPMRHREREEEALSLSHGAAVTIHSPPRLYNSVSSKGGVVGKWVSLWAAGSG